MKREAPITSIRRFARIATAAGLIVACCGLLVASYLIVEVFRVGSAEGSDCKQQVSGDSLEQSADSKSALCASLPQGANGGGTTSWQLTQPSTITGHQIEGYAHATSVLPGHSIAFSVRTSAPFFSADVFRMGWYGGAGARLMESVEHLLGHVYEIPVANQKHLVEANWPVAFSITPQLNWSSGMYMVKLTDARGYQSYIPFVVRALTTSGTLVFVHAVNTDEAYNYYGDASLYPNIRPGTWGVKFNDLRARVVSFDRPFIQNFGAGQFFRYEYPFVRWAERSGYHLSYVTDVDIHEHPMALLDAKGVIVVGHNEYWSKEMRDTYDAAVAHGVNLANLAANTSYWQIRYGPDASGVPDRRIIGYKGLATGQVPYNGDPEYGKNNDIVSTQFGDPLLHRSEQYLLGVHLGGDYEPLWAAPFKVQIPVRGVFGKLSQDYSWIYANTGLKNGDEIKNMIGYEYDNIDMTLGAPSGLAIVGTNHFTDVRGNVDRVDTTIYTSPSGAVVFSSGTIDWAWGLDNYAPQAPDPYSQRPLVPGSGMKAVQRMTANILNHFLAVGAYKPAAGIQ